MWIVISSSIIIYGVNKTIFENNQTIFIDSIVNNIGNDNITSSHNDSISDISNNNNNNTNNNNKHRY